MQSKKNVFSGIIHPDSYLPRTIADWNCLPEEIVSASSLDSFESNLSPVFKLFF